jgi:hypothetical protein
LNPDLIRIRIHNSVKIFYSCFVLLLDLDPGSKLSILSDGDISPSGSKRPVEDDGGGSVPKRPFWVHRSEDFVTRSEGNRRGGGYGDRGGRGRGGQWWRGRRGFGQHTGYGGGGGYKN